MELVSKSILLIGPPRVITFGVNSVIYRNPVYHQVVFASLMLITAIRIHYLLTLSEVSKRIPSEVRSSMGVLFATGLGLFAFGFFEIGRAHV